VAIYQGKEMDFIKVILGIFFPSILDTNKDYELDLKLETTVDAYTGNAFDGGEVEESNAYDKYSVS